MRHREIGMRNGVQVTPAFMSVLVHEMGHTLGLADTYLRGVDWGKPELDKGGADSHQGHPAGLDHVRCLQIPQGRGATRPR